MTEHLCLVGTLKGASWFRVLWVRAQHPACRARGAVLENAVRVRCLPPLAQRVCVCIASSALSPLSAETIWNMVGGGSTGSCRHLQEGTKAGEPGKVHPRGRDKTFFFNCM